MDTIKRIRVTGKKKMETLDIRPQWRNPASKIPQEWNHNAFDTETLGGKLFMACDNHGNCLSLPHDIRPEVAALQILAWLTSSTFRTEKGRVNWLYNLNYDVRAVIAWLPEACHRELYATSHTTYQGYELGYIASKVFSIKLINEKKGRRSIFFDISQFYMTKGLDRVSKEILGQEKISTIDTRRLGSEPDYWDEVGLDEIRRYCVHDAWLTAELGKKFQEDCINTLNFFSSKPYSTGNLAERYFLGRSFIPQVTGIPKEVLRLHWHSYHGGRIETLKRGYFPKIWGIDVNSCYPHKMLDLIDFTEGGSTTVKRKWQKADDITVFEDGVTLPAVFHVRLRWFDPYVGVVPVQTTSGLIYPIGEFDCIINEEEWKFILEKGGEILEVYEGYEFLGRARYPFRAEILNLHEIKTRKKAEGDRDGSQTAKIMMNSIYGKTAQTQKITDPNLEGLNELADNYMYYTGAIWNPIYASRITSLSRLQLLRDNWDVRDHIIGYATDAVYADIPLQGSGEGLGSWELEVDGKEAIFLMSGVRWIDGKTKLRGFPPRRKVGDHEYITIDLKDLINEYPNETVLPTTSLKPVGLFESLQTGNLNQFKEYEKGININSDSRRFWLTEFEKASDIWDTVCHSTPILFNE